MEFSYFGREKDVACTSTSKGMLHTPLHGTYMTVNIIFKLTYWQSFKRSDYQFASEVCKVFIESVKAISPE